MPDGNQGQNPWGSGNRGNNQGPPDLDEVVRTISDRLKEIEEQVSGFKTGEERGGARSGEAEDSAE